MLEWAQRMFARLQRHLSWGTLIDDLGAELISMTTCLLLHVVCCNAAAGLMKTVRTSCQLAAAY
jgi:hypothetical protein